MRASRRIIRAADRTLTRGHIKWLVCNSCGLVRDARLVDVGKIDEQRQPVCVCGGSVSPCPKKKRETAHGFFCPICKQVLVVSLIWRKAPDMKCPWCRRFLKIRMDAELGAVIEVET